MLLRGRNILKLYYKFYSTKNVVKNNIKYTNTINLPKTKFPTRLTETKRREVEKNLIESSFANLYNYQEKHKLQPSFVLHDGPPYANGDLHMGHAVNKILKDITLRHNVVNNVSIHYKAGWDCHGLPIELKALKGKTNANSIEIRKKSRQFALQTIDKQKSEFQSWGVMADWNKEENIYKTLNPKFIENQLKIFLEFYKNKLVYRDLKPVYWSPSSKTALAEAELEYDSNYISPSVILRLKLSRFSKALESYSKKLYAMIWTTTPWTLPSNQAICYNSELEYSIIKLENDSENFYLIATPLLNEFKSLTNMGTEIVATISGCDLEGCKYFHPINIKEELDILPANHVKDSKGTGLVHTAPAHGPEDFLVSLTHKIKIKCIVDENGKYTSEAPSFLIGKNVLDEGNSLVLNYLENDILFSGKLTHSYPIDWRTKKPVIIRASEQWFMNTDLLKEKAIEEINKVTIYPKVNSESNKKALVTQIKKRPYWCISRQRAWGVPIPVFYNKITKEVIINDEIMARISSLLQTDQTIDFWWSKTVADLLPKQLTEKLNIDIDLIEKGEDIFDIWFDSGITWFNALEGNKIADLYLEGFDQFTGWFQSSLLTSVALRGCAPYRSIFVHGFTVDEKGHKMSKSLGNVISPKEITQKFGTDVLRWWVASHGTQHSSITVSKNLIQGSSDTLMKFRSILRYLNGVLAERSASLVEKPLENVDVNHLDKYFLNELFEFEEQIRKYYASYEYNHVVAVLQNFTANQLSSIYLHIIKDRLYCGSSKEHEVLKHVLSQCYGILCKVLWPIIPFMVEESWSYYDKKPFYEHNVASKDEWKSLESKNLIDFVLSLKKTVNQSIKDVNTWNLSCQINCNADDLKLLQKLHPINDESISSSELCDILQVSNITLSLGSTPNVEISLNQVENILCPRCRRYSITDNEDLCSRCKLVLAN